jgi:hypothetical protein
VPYRWIDDEIVESHEATVVQSTEVENPESNVEVGDADEAAVNAEEDVVAAIEHAEGTSGARVELYDSGSTCHLSPYRADFQNFEDLPAHPFKTANTMQ